MNNNLIWFLTRKNFPKLNSRDNLGICIKNDYNCGGMMLAG